MTDCNHKGSRVLDSRRRDGYKYRRHYCKSCKTNFSSAEFIIDDTSSGVHMLDSVANGSGLARDLFNKGYNAALSDLVSSFGVAVSDMRKELIK